MPSISTATRCAASDVEAPWVFRVEAVLRDGFQQSGVFKPKLEDFLTAALFHAQSPTSGPGDLGLLSPAFRQRSAAYFRKGSLLRHPRTMPTPIT